MKWKRRMGAYLIRELELISDVQERHYDPIKYPVPRVGVVMENRPDHELDEVEKQKKRRKRLSKKAMSLVDQGMLDEGLVPFREEVVSFTAECIARKSRLVEQIDEVLQKPDALAVVSILGSAHTPEAYEIRARGYKTSVEIRGREGHTYWFDAYAALMRHCIQFGAESLSLLDWHKGMIGARMYPLIVQMAKDKSLGVSYQELLKKGSIFLRERFQSVSDVRRFEGKVRDMGFDQAIAVFANEAA